MYQYHKYLKSALMLHLKTWKVIPQNFADLKAPLIEIGKTTAGIVALFIMPFLFFLAPLGAWLMKKSDEKEKARLTKIYNDWYGEESPHNPVNKPGDWFARFSNLNPNEEQKRTL